MSEFLYFIILKCYIYLFQLKVVKENNNTNSKKINFDRKILNN